MAETLLLHDSLCSVTHVDPFGRLPVSICLTLVNRLQEEQINIEDPPSHKEQAGSFG